MFAKQQNFIFKLKPKSMETQLKTKTPKKVAKGIKKFKSTKTTITLGTRVIREGEKIPLEKLLKSVNAPTREKLDGLSKKFGIEWKPTAFDNTLPKDAKSGPNHSFIVEGKTKQGNKKVFYDRFQFGLFVDGKKAPTSNPDKMSKNQFSKLIETT
jgi:hypothetical protein